MRFDVLELTRFLQFLKRSQGSNISIKKATTIQNKRMEASLIVREHAEVFCSIVGK